MKRHIESVHKNQTISGIHFHGVDIFLNVLKKMIYCKSIQIETFELREIFRIGLIELKLFSHLSIRGGVFLDLRPSVLLPIRPTSTWFYSC